MKSLALTVFMGLTFVGMFFIFPYEEPGVFFLEYVLIPLVIIILMIPLYLHQKVARLPLALCVIMALSYIVFSVFYAPRIMRFAYDSPSASHFKKRIQNYYMHAQNMRNIDEVMQYIELYTKYFPNDPWNFPNLHKLLEVDTKDISKFVQMLHLIKYSDNHKRPSHSSKISTKFTPLTYLNLRKSDLIQKVTEYLNDSEFYAANLLLRHYVNTYGNTIRSKRLQTLIEQHIENIETSYAEQNRIQLQEQIQFLYDALLTNNVNENMLKAYYQSIALNNNYPSNEQLEWLKNMYYQKLNKEIFFADEARIALLKSTKKIPLMFVENGESHRTLWIAQDVSYVNNIAYLENIELIRIQGKTPKNESIKNNAPIVPNGAILWHIKSLYAKLVNNKLMLYSLEPGNIVTRNIPQLTSEYEIFKTVPWNITTSVKSNEIMFLHFPINEFFFKTRSAITYLLSIPLWKKHSLLTSLLYREMIRTLLDILLLTGMLYVLIKVRVLYAKNNYLPSFAYIYVWHIGLVCTYSITKAYSATFLDQAINNNYYNTYLLNAPITIITAIVCLLSLLGLMNMIRKLFTRYKRI